MTDRYIGTGRVTISFGDLCHHIYLLGATGCGKTTIMRLIAKGLEEANKSGEFESAFIYADQKGDDSFKFLAQVDALDPERVTFLDPVLTGFSVNPLELPPYSPTDRERIVSVYVGFLMSIIQEWYQTDQTKAPRLTRIMRSLVSYLYHRNDAPTLLDLYDLVLRMQSGDDPVLMRDLEDTLGGSEVGMLKREMEAIGGMKEEAFDPVLTRLSEFAIDPFLRKMFSVRHSSVNFAELLKPGHTTIVRIAGHEMGSHISPLIASVIVLKLWFTIQERASRAPEMERSLVVLSLDEFQSIQHLQAIQTVLAQARAFGLALILSHQTSSQLSDELFHIVVGNCAFQGCGRVGGDDARRIAYTWDPQFAKEIQQTLTTQADFRWSFRIRPEPGREMSPPITNVPISPPPPEIHTWDEVKAFIDEQKRRYGIGVVERPILEEAEEKAGEWMKFSAVLPVPTKEEWALILALNDRTLNVMRAAERAGVEREVAGRILGRLRASGVVRAIGSDRAGSEFYTLDPGALPSLKPESYQGIGGAEARQLAMQVVKLCLERGWFVAPGRQDVGMERKFDIVSFDYSRNVPIAIEVESEEHVLHDHPEQLKKHMLEIDPFNEMFVVTTKGEAERKVLELRSQLPLAQQDRVTVVAF